MRATLGRVSVDFTHFIDARASVQHCNDNLSLARLVKSGGHRSALLHEATKAPLRRGRNLCGRNERCTRRKCRAIPSWLLENIDRDNRVLQ